MKKNYGEILKQAIKDSGLKQKELAEKIGESQQTISNWINRNDISLVSFVRICEGIGINPASIVDNGNNKDNFSNIHPGWIKLVREFNTWDWGTQQDFLEYIDNGLKLLKKRLKEK